MTYHILTIFPDIFTSFLKESILARAQDEGKVKINIHDIRDYAEDKHKKVDDTPYGGGPGMVMKIEPIYKAIKELGLDKLENSKTILMAPRGQQFGQKKAEDFSKLENLVIICGRYEGIDQRVADNLCDEEISIGPYVLNGGEVPAMTIIEATFRLLPNVLGNEESTKAESFSHKNILEAPQYTKPEKFSNWEVPGVLLSGNHKKIDEWRQKNSQKI